MTDIKPIRRIAIVGTGVIGASWTALFLAKGLAGRRDGHRAERRSLAEKIRGGCVAGAQSIGPVARSVAVELKVHGGAPASNRRRRPGPGEWA